jgi:hypothetical protein
LATDLNARRGIAAVRLRHELRAQRAAARDAQLAEVEALAAAQLLLLAEPARQPLRRRAEAVAAGQQLDRREGAVGCRRDRHRETVVEQHRDQRRSRDRLPRVVGDAAPYRAGAGTAGGHHQHHVAPPARDVAQLGHRHDARARQVHAEMHGGRGDALQLEPAALAGGGLGAPLRIGGRMGAHLEPRQRPALRVEDAARHGAARRQHQVLGRARARSARDRPADLAERGVAGRHQAFARGQLLVAVGAVLRRARRAA